MAESTTKRRPRLTDAETERRMLDTAVAQVLQRGLSVGVDDLGFEALIEAAGVSRSTVYRKWPSREDFYARLLVDLAGHEQLGLKTFAATDLPRMLAHLAGDPAWRETPEGRRRTLVELLRVGGQSNYAHDPTRAQVRTLIALVALLASSPHLAAEIGTSLVRSEDRSRSILSEIYQRIAAWVGTRTIPGVTWEHVATLGSAALIGVMVQEGGRPRRDESFVADPFRTGHVAEWTSASLSYAAMLLGLTELDPDFDPSAAPATPNVLDTIA